MSVVEPALTPETAKSGDTAQKPGRKPPTLWTSWLVLAATGILGIALLAGLAWAYFASASPVMVKVDGMASRLYTHQATVAALLAEIELTLEPEDTLSPAPATPLHSGMAIQIARARPVLLRGDGQLRLVRTHAVTVGDVLREQAIVIGPADELELQPLRGPESLSPVEKLRAGRSARRILEPGTPVTADTRLPQIALNRERNLPGVPNIYPWRGTAAQPVEIALRRAVPVVLHQQGAASTIWTTASTLGEALARQGMTFYEGDLIQPGLGTPVTAGMAVSIERSKPVTIRTKEHAMRTRTREQNVAHLLAEQGLVLTGLDRIDPALDTPLTDDMDVSITRVQQVFEVEEEVKPYASVWEPDPETEIDQLGPFQEGVNGITRHRFKVVLEDGQPITRTLEDTWLAQEPITRTFRYGTKIVMRELQTSEGPVSYWRKIRMYATSYSPANSGVSPDVAYYGRTRLGLKVQRGVVAVDPRIVLLRSRVYVPGYGNALAADTGGGVNGRWIDLGFADGEYESWHRCVDVYLLGPPPPPYAITYRLPNWPNSPCGW